MSETVGIFGKWKTLALQESESSCVVKMGGGAGWKEMIRCLEEEMETYGRNLL